VIVSAEHASTTSSVATLTLLLPPSVTTLAATNVGAHKATLTGTVNPKGTNAAAYFEWGTTTGYGYCTPPQDVGSGTNPVMVTAQISNLTHYTTYHYRLVATNVVFRSNGNNVVFTTLPAPPVVSSFSPMAGPTGTVVTVTGSNLTGASHVWFNGMAAQFTSLSDTQLQAVVPAGATYGRIIVAGPGGVGASPSGFVARPAGATITRPSFPPPLGCKFIESSSPDEGAIGRAGGKTWYFYDVALANSAVVYWAPTNLGVRLSFVQSPFPGPYHPAEVLTFSPGLSDLLGGVAVWSGQTRLPPSYSTVYTRFTLRVKDIYNNPLSLVGAGALGLSTNIGAVLVVTPGLMFQANMIFEASFSASGPFQPAIEFYDAQQSPAVGGTAYTSFGAGFCYENTPPVFTSGPFPDFTVPRNTPIGPVNFMFNDAETGPSSVNILSCVSSNQALLPINNIQLSRTAADAAFLRAYPVGNQSGKTLVTVLITDGSITNNQSFLLTVNNPPRLDRNDPLFIEQGTSQVINNSVLAASDTENGPAQLVYTVAPGGAGAPPHNGWLQLNGTNLVGGDTFTQEDLNLGRLTYVHDGSCATNDDFTFNVTDANGAVAPTGQYTTYTFRLNIVPANHPPVAHDDIVNIPLGGSVTSSLRATETDCPPVMLTFRVISNATKGVFNLIDPSTGAFTYTAGQGQTGRDTVVFQVNDGVFDAETSGAVTFIISNQAPIAHNASVVTKENMPVQAVLSAIDADMPAQPLVYHVVSNSAKGTVSLINPATGEYVYQPNPNAIGVDTFCYVVTDGELESAPALVTVQIRPNLDPGDIIVSDSVTRRVVLIDTSGLQGVLAESNLLTSPKGIALSPKDVIYVMDDKNGLVGVDPATGEQTMISARTNFSTGGLGPVHIAVERTGTILVADGVEGIKRVDPSCGSVSVLSAGGNLVLPIGLTLSPSGQIYVADLSTFAGQQSRIVRVDPVTGVQSVVSIGDKLLGPVGIAIDNNGRIAVSDAATFVGCVFRANSDSDSDLIRTASRFNSDTVPI